MSFYSRRWLCDLLRCDISSLPRVLDVFSAAIYSQVLKDFVEDTFPTTKGADICQKRSNALTYKRYGLSSFLWVSVESAHVIESKVIETGKDGRRGKSRRSKEHTSAHNYGAI
ncbi:hypothetical protein EYC80_001697 [Monilinia laxa]|uniref:Uncharacterized protein n=1 Tax=Monilinia laxa TaxID=61186 RepID=A0A5N6K5R0_MONLA|nr:hypothetical protein EYC80_001697 [Monilinia laxa]